MADFLGDDEQAERIRQLWKDYGIAVVAGIVLAIALVVGTQLYRDHRQETRVAAADLYSQFETARAVGGDIEAVLTQFESEYPTSQYRVFALMYLAKDAVDDRDYVMALEHSAIALSIVDSKALRDLLLIRHARLQKELGMFEEAATSLASVETGYETMVNELVGDIRLAQNMHDEAISAYESALDVTEGFFATRRLESKLASIPATSTDMPAMTEEEYEELERQITIEVPTDGEPAEVSAETTSEDQESTGESDSDASDEQ